MSKVNGTQSMSRLSDLKFLNEDDPVKLLSSNNYLDQLVPIIKSSLKSNTVDQLISKLQAEDLKKEDELSTLLIEHEENIATSSYDLAKVSRDASDVSEQLLDINDHLARTSNLTISKKFKLLELKKNISKINESEILINRVLQVLELTDKTQELINNNKFFNALRSLNDLATLDKDFDKDFIFLNTVNDSIPVLRNLIREESLSQLKRNLNSLDNKYEQLTSIYYDGFTEILIEWESFKSVNKDFAQYKVNSSVEKSLRYVYVSNPLMDNPDEFLKVSFIYDTLLVFKTLDQLEFFKNEFNKELYTKRDKVLYPFQINDVKNDNFKNFIKNEENLKSFLSRIIGFLIMHSIISVKFPSLIIQSTNDQWENLSTKIYPFLKNLILNEIHDIEKIISLKKILGNFNLILEHFKLNHDHFYNLLILSFKKFSNMSQFQFVSEFMKLTEEDDSMPMVIYDLKLYRKITNVGWYVDQRSESSLEFPQILPFSTVYPMACAQVRNYITQQQNFLKDYFKYDLNSLQKLIIENIDVTFLKSINKYYNDKLDLITREELSQNLINLEYFLIMTKEISSQLSETFEKEIVLSSIDAITNTRKKTEEKLFEIVVGKIDDLTDFIDWDWQTLAENIEPTYFIKDIGDFLKNMFNSTFSNLSYSVKTLLVFKVFDLLATRFLEDLYQQTLITEASIINFDIDISYIENITQEINASTSSSSSNSQDSTTSSADPLQSMFLQLRQTINLLKTGNLEEYKDPSIRNRKYDQVKPDIAVQLMNKLEKGREQLSTEERNVRSPAQQQSPASPSTPSGASKYFAKFRSGSTNANV